MFPTRTTRSPAPLVCALAVGLAGGCDGPPRADGPDAPRAAATTPTRVAAKAERAPTAVPHPLPPKPDANRLRYDASSRTLEVYDPPVPGGRWMLSTPKEPRGMPVDGVYQFPPMVDVDGVTVFYVAANGKPSEPVSLREIIEAKDFSAKH